MTKITLADILAKKRNNEKIVCLTAYSYPIAKIIDDYCDIILVGDSLAMTIYGLKDTVEADLSMMINHSKAVIRAAKKSFIVVDLPCGSYEKSKEIALQSAKKIINETNCDAIKIETSQEQVEIVRYLVENNIKVMSHIGLLPQRVREIGGYKYQGKEKKQAEEIIKTAKMLEDAGSFAIVIEAVPAILADQISACVNIPTIGIGASVNCDGQILVIDDLLGLNQEFKAKFVKQYSDLASIIKDAVKNYRIEVLEKKFPAEKNML
jgi:3-methyl-2-oxobutanoate hydroxymethyltransferase